MTFILLISIAAGIFVLAFTFRPFFGDFSGFKECFAFLKGDTSRMRFSELKLGIWISLGYISGFVVYILFHEIFYGRVSF